MNHINENRFNSIPPNTKKRPPNNEEAATTTKRKPPPQLKSRNAEIQKFRNSEFGNTEIQKYRNSDLTLYFSILNL